MQNDKTGFFARQFDPGDIFARDRAFADMRTINAHIGEKADIDTKHLIVARLIERVDVSSGYKVHIKFKISLKQFLGQE